MVLWEVLFMLVILKIPLVYVSWVIWWAVQSEPEVGAEGGPHDGLWMPWRRRPRPPRSGPHGTPNRASTRDPSPGRRAAA
jgi:hypothetical protein